MFWHKIWYYLSVYHVIADHDGGQSKSCRSYMLWSEQKWFQNSHFMNICLFPTIIVHNRSQSMLLCVDLISILEGTEVVIVQSSILEARSLSNYQQ